MFSMKYFTICKEYIHFSAETQIIPTNTVESRAEFLEYKTVKEEITILYITTIDLILPDKALIFTIDILQVVLILANRTGEIPDEG